MLLFISKDNVPEAFLSTMRNYKIQCICNALISFEKVKTPFPDNTSFDIIFFTSPRCVSYFLNEYSLPENSEIASIGKTTTQALEKWGYRVAFTGKTSGKPEEVSKEFKHFVGSKTVLFPQSNRSNQSMQKQLKKEQIINLIIYNTLFQPIQLIQTPDILVFTSPSNVVSFLLKNKIHPHQQLIAWGTTTSSAMQKQGFQPHHTLRYSSFEELEEIIKEI